jgi:UDP-N-acetylglucosamine diphosphorylase/glucosamine-1-phosphate N-acetyltransferase
MKINLDDNGLHLRFAPLTLSRPVGNLRMGIYTNDERWERLLPDCEVGFITEPFLQYQFPKLDTDIRVNAQVIPNEEVAASLFALEEGCSLYMKDLFIAENGTGKTRIEYLGNPPIVIENRWDLFQQNEAAIQLDYRLITEGRASQELSKTNTLIGPSELLFMEEGASVEGSILNTTHGPIYIGEHAEVMEGSMIRGAFVLCEDAVVKMGAKIYGATTIGPHCRVGGEVSNVILMAYSNKGHDGFLGNSVIGEWCNLGADTNSSNLKNNYSSVSSYNYESKSMESCDTQFMGLCMGDHSKSAINTMFNTATVIGFAVNVFADSFPPKHLPSFTWLNGKDQEVFQLEKSIQAAKAMMDRRQIEWSEADQKIFEHLHHFRP